MNIMKEPRSYLPVALSYVCKDNQTLLKDGKKGSIDLWRDKKVWAWMKFKLREFSCSNMEE
jgi:hypothetical protein